MLLKSNDTQITQQIITLMKLILSMNYFIFQNKIYQPEKGVSMGSLISRTKAKIFLQHLADIHIKQLLDTKNIIFYTKYVRWHLKHIWHQTNKQTNPLINKYINQTHTNIKLNPTHKSNGCMSFLHLLIIQKPSNLEIDIFRKPTTTDTTINFLSNHPMQPKIATNKHYITRIHSLPLTQKRKQTEWTLLQSIAQNNNFPQKLIQNLNGKYNTKKKPTRIKPMEKTKTKNGQPSHTTAQE